MEPDATTGATLLEQSAGGHEGASAWIGCDSLWWNAEISPGSAAFRLAAALVLAGVVGFEREARGKTAGLRTHMLVGMASALFTLLAFELYHRVQAAGGENNADPLRLLEAITAGVAFLAAGAIFRSGDKVKNLTTGSGLWMAGAVGMACGLGSLGLAAMATAMAMVVLSVIRLLEPKSAKEEDD